jgi:hypothetical protein
VPSLSEDELREEWNRKFDEQKAIEDAEWEIEKKELAELEKKEAEAKLKELQKQKAAEKAKGNREGKTTTT